jgi:hypothetical protein
MSVNIVSKGSSTFNLYSLSILMYISDTPVYDTNSNNRKILATRYFSDSYYDVYEYHSTSCNTVEVDLYSYVSFYKRNSASSYFYLPLSLFETNVTDNVIGVPYSLDYYLTINLYDSNSNLLNTYTSDDNFPVYYADGYDSFISSRYTTVDLDKYNYVILNLKDYSKTEAFSSNLQVKGMIGITPIYNYGTTEKDSVTDRCNLSYSDFTDYRLYILDSDLTNKAVYAVKACEDNSSFKFDNTIFDITYVTDENIDDPVITIDGIDYHTIPFADLSVTANSNEDNNYIPGESSNIASGDKSSLKSILENVTDTLSDIWDTIIYFFSFVTKVFSILPTEIKAISLTTFITGCILGLIKILKS